MGFNGTMVGAPTAGAKAKRWSNLFDRLVPGNTPADPNADGAFDFTEIRGLSSEGNAEASLGAFIPIG